MDEDAVEKEGETVEVDEANLGRVEGNSASAGLQHQKEANPLTVCQIKNQVVNRRVSKRERETKKNSCNEMPLRRQL